MKKHSAFLIATFNLFVISVAAQDDTQEPKQYRSSVFLELSTFRGAVAGTINYEVFVSKKPGGVSFRAGLGGTVSDNDIILTMPANVSYSIPVEVSKKHFVELGLGFTGYIFTAPDGFGSVFGWWPIPIWNGIVGYRYMSNRLHVRVSYMPRLIMLDPENQGLTGIVGVSCGIRF